jgi:hypothetical protein
MRTVEKLILDAAPELLGKGDAAVVDQHSALRRGLRLLPRARD